MAAVQGDFDCAILDLNLGGDSVYPVAQALAERHIPFAFVTGYGRESIDNQFDGVPILQKPITRESLESCLHDLLELDPSGRLNERSPKERNRKSPPALTA
jgi:hypothetical protein